ncbi:MAG: hypothetical protein KR126chlam1_00419 [Chlamydiae bacterium]|nr:hypothetical protein [Chlamydiota bacterium]
MSSISLPPYIYQNNTHKTNLKEGWEAKELSIWYTRNNQYSRSVTYIKQLDSTDRACRCAVTILGIPLLFWCCSSTCYKDISKPACSGKLYKVENYSAYTFDGTFYPNDRKSIMQYLYCTIWKTQTHAKHSYILHEDGFFFIPNQKWKNIRYYGCLLPNKNKSIALNNQARQVCEAYSLSRPSHVKGKRRSAESKGNKDPIELFPPPNGARYQELLKKSPPPRRASRKKSSTRRAVSSSPSTPLLPMARK